MEGAQRGPMADAHDGGTRETGPDEPVQLRFGGLVERGGGLVEEEPLRPLHESADERDALLLPGERICAQWPGSSRRATECGRPHAVSASRSAPSSTPAAGTG